MYHFNTIKEASLLRWKYKYLISNECEKKKGIEQICLLISRRLPEVEERKGERNIKERGIAHNS